MRLIAVIDMLNDEAVRAVKGERRHYKPVQSVLCDTSDPYSLAIAFRNRLGLKDLYIADLNAIQGIARESHREIISNLAGNAGMAIMLDAGASNAQEVRSVLALGVQKAVVGAETLNRRVDLRTIIEAVDPDQLVFSLDMRAGKVLSRCSELAALPVLELLGELQAAGWREVILLDLSRVGTGQGALSSIILETKMDLKILIGGGISGLEELIQLKLMGVEGALLATAFHNGTITNSSLRVLELL